jgi:iron complex outermembrane receptor protein
MITSRRTLHALLFAASALPSMACAQTGDVAAPQSAPEEAGEIIVTGTRATGMQAADSAAPIQLLGADALAKVGQPNLNQALTQMVPSFQAQSQGTDMASFSLSARLRGLNPNHTLVMVNGKRRHGNSILQVINGAFGGSAAPSIDLIPPDIVQRIEILQEGAAAQYGSDAIAGVINIILKSDTAGGKINSSVGQYYDGEGRTYSASGNIGLPLGDSGYLDVSLFHRRNEYTTIGDGQIAARNLDGSTVTNISPAFKPIYDALNARNGTAGINGGQPKSNLNIAFYNAGYDFGGVELYSFGNVSHRDSAALQAYRPPNRICVTNTDPTTCYAPTVTSGMVPLIEVKQDEFSITNGIRGSVDDWDWDLSGTYSEDRSFIYTTGSAHLSLFQDTFRATAATPTTVDSAYTPRDFYDGGFKFIQFVTTLDVRKGFDVGLSEDLTFAIGGEYRRERYSIFAGDSGSQYKEGGQSFPGYLDSDAGSSVRNAKSIYANVILKPVADWSVDLAGRYENYSDFGGTTIGKITTRYDFTPTFALRATASTGFRAPTMAESNYSATNVSPTAATVQLPPSSAASTALGFGPLKPEKSTSLSAGIVVRPVSRMIVTLDGYYIKINDRIASSGTITGRRNGVPILTPLINGMTPYDAVNAAIAASGKAIDPTVGTLGVQTFTNGIDTRTFGIEFSARYPITLDFGKLDLTVGANYNDTEVTQNRLGNLFNAQARAILETSSPKFKSVFGALFTKGDFSANLRGTYYSKSTVLVSPAVTIASAPITGNFFPADVAASTIFDLELGYDLSSWVSLSVGANNLFNKKPNIPGLVKDYDPSVTIASGTSPYISGSTTINAPFTHGPYGTNGGYYYARLTFNF